MIAAKRVIEITAVNRWQDPHNKFLEIECIVFYRIDKRIDICTASRSECNIISGKISPDLFIVFFEDNKICLLRKRNCAEKNKER